MINLLEGLHRVLQISKRILIARITHMGTEITIVVSPMKTRVKSFGKIIGNRIRQIIKVGKDISRDLINGPKTKHIVTNIVPSKGVNLTSQKTHIRKNNVQELMGLRLKTYQFLQVSLRLESLFLVPSAFSFSKLLYSKETLVKRCNTQIVDLCQPQSQSWTK